MTKFTAYIFRTVAFIACLFAFSIFQEANARFLGKTDYHFTSDFFQRADTTPKPDTSRYPISDRRGDPYTFPNRNSFDLKDTSYIKRNIVYDPVYLTEPLVRSQEYRLNLNLQIPPYPCDVVEEVDRPKGVVPHQLPGTNTFIKEFADKIHVPEAVIRAGAETMYPEIRKKLK